VLYYYDHLGSIQAVAEYGSDPWTALPAWDRPKSRRALYSYDAWGQRRDPTDWLGGVGGQSTYTYGGSNDITPRGFTGHVPRSEATTPAGREAKAMLDNMGLVHLFRARRVTKTGREAEPEHGRIYDPLLGRFLSADPLVQFAGFDDSYNRYSYVLNNPLRYTDPSGYNITGAFKQYWRPVVTVVVAIVVAYLTQRWDMVYQAFATGFAAGATGSALYGGNLCQVLSTGIKSGFIAVVSANVAQGVGEWAGKLTTDYADYCRAMATGFPKEPSRSSAAESFSQGSLRDSRVRSSTHPAS